jgi:hypothetical protein
MTGIILTGDARCPNGGVILADAIGTSFLCNGVDGSTAAARADGPCFESAIRYVDCGNGTVTDIVTRLIWLRDAACLGGANWVTASRAAAALTDGHCGLTDGSSAGDWRLPTKEEWSATMARAFALGCLPALTNDAGTGCLLAGPSSFVGVSPTNYWSGTAEELDLTEAFDAHIAGFVSPDSKSSGARVWPVRSGAR